LRQAGFAELAHIDMATIPEAAALLRNPPRYLYAFAAPKKIDIVANAPNAVTCGSSLRWQAKQGEDYTVKYNYNPNFVAMQGKHVLPLEAVQPFSGVSTRFMRVKAVKNGEIELWFRPFPAFFPDWLCGRLSKRS
jgi:hypothetical protein